MAVSTAHGMLNHIVVNTTAGAQKCLEYLRAQSLGRANFIPLENMKKGAHDTRVNKISVQIDVSWWQRLNRLLNK